MTNNFDSNFYKGKKVFVTGHTGFKGTWLCKILLQMGAVVTGYALNPPTNPALYTLVGLENQLTSVVGDIRDYVMLEKAFKEAQPEIVFHLAAQPIVTDGYLDPLYTYETNVMGTVNILECVRKNTCVKSFLNVTTDKVYMDQEKNGGYVEEDILNGHDPYSNSKSCSELVTHSYRKSFFDKVESPAISTVRSGNVIGGGDFAKNRIVPDCVKAVMNGDEILIRNPESVRPYQHVLEPLYVYLMIAAMQYKDKAYAGSYNVGPKDEDCIRTGKLVELFALHWGGDVKWQNLNREGFHETNILRLNSSKLKEKTGWESCWDINKAIQKTVEWSKCWANGDEICGCMEKQIEEYMNEMMSRGDSNG